jgi:ankyrin repeat protein
MDFLKKLLGAETVFDMLAKNDITNLKLVLKKNPKSINAADKYGWTPLHYAIDKGNIEIAKFLISKGAQVNVPDAKGTTPLHCAVEIARRELVILLLDNGADITAKDKQGRSPLKLAMDNNHQSIAELLRVHGATD